MQGSVGRLEDNSQDKQKESEKQKEQEISLICSDIIKHRLSKFCKLNAAALGLIFKALMRGEAVYPKMQFLQDCNANALLSRKNNLQELTNQKSLYEDSKKSLKNIPSQQESSINKKSNHTKAKSQTIILKDSKIAGERKIELSRQECDSKKNKESTQENLPSFPLSIEG